MKVDAPLVQHVANLANLRLSDAELKHYETQLGNILGYVAQLNEIELKAADPFSLDAVTPEREDVAAKSLATERAMAEAPQKVGTAFQVPRILE